MDNLYPLLMAEKNYKNRRNWLYNPSVCFLRVLGSETKKTQKAQN